MLTPHWRYDMRLQAFIASAARFWLEFLVSKCVSTGKPSSETHKPPHKISNDGLRVVSRLLPYTHVFTMMSNPLNALNSLAVVRTSLDPGVATMSSCRPNTKRSSSLSSNAALTRLLAAARGASDRLILGSNVGVRRRHGDLLHYLKLFAAEKDNQTCQEGF